MAHGSFVEDEWNITANNLKDGGEKLRELVIKCCKEKFGMKDDGKSPLSIVKAQIPKTFHVEGQGIVELQLVIDEYDIKDKRHDSRPKKASWTIKIDADMPLKESTQPPHFGYTVFRTIQLPNTGKFTGHVWLPRSPMYSRQRETQAPIAPVSGWWENGEKYYWTLSKKTN